MSSEPDYSTDIGKIAAGGAGGFICGAALGAGVALMLGSSSGVVWGLLILHSGLAMMAMGAWVAPSLLSTEGNDERADVDQRENQS